VDLSVVPGHPWRTEVREDYAAALRKAGLTRVADSVRASIARPR
jgi:hypothetical protein